MAIEPSHPKPTPDPRRSAFWMFISFLGISMPKPGNERKAMRTIIIGVILFLGFVATGLFVLFRLW
jgi:hypothetical protein